MVSTGWEKPALQLLIYIQLNLAARENVYVKLLSLYKKFYSFGTKICKKENFENLDF